jgi:hypothetical protein
MEGQARQHVMNVRNHCLSILLSPDVHGLDQAHGTAITLQQTMLFLRNVLTEFSTMRTTVDNMKFMHELVRTF